MEKYTVSYKTPSGAPPEAFDYARETARRAVGSKLFEALWKNGLPAVVDLEEEINQVPSGYVWADNEYRINITIDPVQWHQVFAPSYAPALEPVQQDTTALREQLAYMTFGFVSLLMIILWTIFT